MKMFKRLSSVAMAALALLSVSAVSFAQKENPVTAPAASPSAAAPKMKMKTMPARDAKGRFIKKGTVPLATTNKMKTMPSKNGMMPSATKRPLPLRDAKGRFMKKGAMAPAASPAAPPAPKAP